MWSLELPLQFLPLLTPTEECSKCLIFSTPLFLCAHLIELHYLLLFYSQNVQVERPIFFLPMYPHHLALWGVQMQLVFIICGFCIWEFTYLLEFIWNPKTNTHGAFMVVPRHAQSGKNVSRLKCLFPDGVEQGDILPPRFSSHTVNDCPFSSLFSATLSHFWQFVCDFAFLNGSQIYAAVLPGVP